MKEPSTGPKLHTQERWQCGISYITCPIDQDRDEYIQNCFMTGTVSILAEAGGMINNVPVDENTIQRIEFPDEGNIYGSQVFYLTDPIHNKPVIITILSEENKNQDNEENEYVIKRKFSETSYCEIRLNPKHETISITSYGDNPNISVSCVGGSYNIVTTEIKTNAVTVLEQVEEAKQCIVGSSDQYSRYLQNSDGFLFEMDNFIIGKQDQPIVLGKILKTILDNLIQTISESTVIVQGTPTPLTNASAIAAFKAQTEQFLSSIGFIQNNEE